jgi:hypothetical protein
MLLAVAPKEVPQDSCFLLEINFAYNYSLTLESKVYCILAVKATTLATQQSDSVLGARAKRIWQKVKNKVPSRKKLGIIAVKQQIRHNKCHLILPNNEHTCYISKGPLLIERFLKHRPPHSSSILALLKSNKHQRKPD